MALKPTNQNQVPDHSILDFYNKQAYLGNAYLVSSNIITLANDDTEVPIMLLSNPSSNSASVGGVQNIGMFHGLRKLSQASNVATATTIFRYYLNPIASNPGTAIVPGNLRPGSGNSSKMLAYINPTITGNVDQVQTITAVADVAGSLNNKYFMIYSINPISYPKAFYVWFNINSAGTDPKIANATGVEVSAATGATASTIGGDIRTALGALTNDFVITGSTSGVIATNVNPGLAPIAADGTAATGFTFVNTTPGVDNYGTFIAAFAVNYQEIDSSAMIIFDPGYSMLVTADTDTGSTNVIAELGYYEL